MTYSKEITHQIVELWAFGLTAEETVDWIYEKKGIRLGLATVYRHRHSLTAQNLVDELLRRQERAIFKQDADNPELAMKYRNELLKILLPKRIEMESKILSKHVEETRDVTIVANYARAVEGAINRDTEAFRARKQVDTAPADTETS